MRRLPSSHIAGPSTSKTVPAAPAILPAWDAGVQDSSGSPPSPARPPVSARLRPPRPNPVSPPPRPSAPMRRSMAIAQKWLAGFPSAVDLSPSDSSSHSAVGVPSDVAGTSPVGAARRASLMEAFALNNSRKLPISAGGLPSTSAARAGESIPQCVPKARRPPVQNGAESSVSATNEKRDDTHAAVGDAPQRQVYLPPRIPGYDARSVPPRMTTRSSEESQRD
ncbi:hypothetical protein FOMPIDRAFT_1048432 [Fomitopsis schrenkii]|uniref:Uncharacterized protein n=1 Tax=Fomitopsis schrenkii TaxID=2126942 RepID=S8FUE4_FOMSC|nr:hypothetical protein FOMPIDRAFT_1048432 [Fomitopsis schrenkii]